MTPMDEQLSEDRVRVLINDEMTKKYVLKEVCEGKAVKFREECTNMKDTIDKLEGRLQKVYTILLVTLSTALVNMLILLLKR
jgi:hypothetical protein